LGNWRLGLRSRKLPKKLPSEVSLLFRSLKLLLLSVLLRLLEAQWTHLLARMASFMGRFKRGKQLEKQGRSGKPLISFKEKRK
jgi:hypothetical protein